MNRGPIIVGGLGRCGKSLLCSLLASHPNIAMPRQDSNLWAFYRQYGALNQHDNFERCLTAMLRCRDVRTLNPNPDRIRKEFWQGESTYARLFHLFHSHYAEQLGKPRWGAYSPNIQYYAGQIFAAYPTVKMIYMIRDPRDRYESVVHRRPARGWRKVSIAAAIAKWLYSVRLAKRYQKQYPQRYKIVRYETLVSRLEKTMRDVFAFLNEDYTPASFTLKGVPQYKGHDVSTAFIGRFRQAMSKREIAFVQAYAKQDMIAHNYELEPVRFSPSDYLLFCLIDQSVNLILMAGWHIWSLGARPELRKSWK